MGMQSFLKSTLAGLAVVCLLGLQTIQAQVTHVGTFLDSTDYSPAGLDLGKDGFIFFNWDAAVNSGGPNDNVNDQLPSWLTYDPNQGGGFGGQVTSKGGLVSITPPSGPAAASGTLVDPEANANSNNTIRQFDLANDRPDQFFLSIVVDNTDGLHNPDDRLRPRLENGGSAELNLGAAGFNGVPDVYRFLVEPGAAGDFIKIQLRSLPGPGGGDGSGNDPGIAGFMIDVVPEPTSIALLGVGTLALGCIRRRR